MIEFSEVFPDSEIVHALSTQLSWTHTLALIPLKDPLRRESPVKCAVYSAGELGQYGHIHGQEVKVMPEISIAKDFWQAVEDWRAQAGFDWPELTPDEVDGWRDRRPASEFSWPD